MCQGAILSSHGHIGQERLAMGAWGHKLGNSLPHSSLVLSTTRAMSETQEQPHLECKLLPKPLNRSESLFPSSCLPTQPELQAWETKPSPEVGTFCSSVTNTNTPLPSWLLSLSQCAKNQTKGTHPYTKGVMSCLPLNLCLFFDKHKVLTWPGNSSQSPPASL